MRAIIRTCDGKIAGAQRESKAMVMNKGIIAVAPAQIGKAMRAVSLSNFRKASSSAPGLSACCRSVDLATVVVGTSVSMASVSGNRVAKV